MKNKIKYPLVTASEMVEMSEASRVMSPRRLENMRNAGSNIINTEKSTKREANYANAKSRQMMEEIASHASRMNEFNSA